MTAVPDRPLIAVDVGNSRIKLGWFQKTNGSEFPIPDRTLRLPVDADDWTELQPWLDGTRPSAVDWRLGSVNRAAASRLIDWLREYDAIGNTMLLSAGDLPLRVDLPHPDMVGIDRLLDAVAANFMRPADRPAVVVDLGTAITVDLVTANGAFQGGAILPGLMTSARALNQFTDMLPLLAELNGAPEAIGKSTLEAMRSGLFWGAVGAIRELVARFTEQMTQPPAVFVAGGSSHVVADLLGHEAKHEPHLTLAGIALAARARMTVVHDVPRTAEATLLTPLGRGAVASIELSGPAATDCIKRCFLPASGLPFSAAPIGQIVYGRWGNASGEEIVACRLNDFTMELHCHGGKAAATRILADLASHRAVVRPWRAVVEAKHGDSIRAAAIVALSDSTTVRTAAILWDQYAGAFERALRHVLAIVRGGETSTAGKLVEQLLARADLGLHLTSPWRVALIGPPNVGKSSLLNALLGYGRAIVHDQPGTTRDLVTGATAFDGWPCLLVDTAGLRNPEDLVESAGVELTAEALREADFVLWVRDATSSSNDHANWRVAMPHNALIVWNKCDLLADTSKLRPAGLCVSALTLQGIDGLVRTIAARLVPRIPPPGSAVPFTQEQVDRLRRIQTAIEQGLAIEAANDLEQWLAVQDHGALPGEIRE